MNVRLTYALTGTGWAECRVEINGASVVTTASYLTDALGDLSSAVHAVLQGHPEPVASFTEEPGEYRWVFSRQPGDGVRIRIFEFSRTLSNAPLDEGTVLLDATCSLVALGEAMVACLEDVQQRYGTDGYAELWARDPFPADRLAELQKVVAEAKGRLRSRQS